MPTRASLVPCALGLTVLLLAGCGAAGSTTGDDEPGMTPTPTSTAPLPATVLGSLEVEIRQSRSDWADRVVQLRVRNLADEAVVIRAAELDAAEFDGPAADPDWGRRVPAGRTRDASVALGPPVCDAAARPPEVTLEVADEAGRTGTVTVQALDPQGHLGRLRGEDCARAAVARGLDVRVGPEVRTELRDGELVAVLDLVVDPVPGGPQVSLERVDGTVLLAPVGRPHWPADGLGDPVVEAGVLPLDLVPTRCDAHAVAEDKRGTFFGLHATVDGVAQPVFHVAVSEDVRGRLHDFIEAHCGW